MSLSPADKACLTTLLQDMRNGRPIGDQSNWLRTQVMQNAEARQLYVDSLWLSGALNLLLKGNESSPAPLPTATVHSSSTVLRLFSTVSVRRGIRVLATSPFTTTLLVAIACYGAFAMLAWNLRSGTLPRISPDNEIAVATVRDATDVRWSKETSAKTDEFAIHSGEPLGIDSGTIELELKSGTKVVVEGPADWSIESANSVSLRAGKLLATVPTQAVGFTVETPTAKIIDSGTEFGVDVDEHGEAEVHVFQGRVVAERVIKSGSELQRIELKRSEAARFTQDQTLVSGLSATPERFQRGKKVVAKQVRLMPNLLGGLQLWLKADAGVYSTFTDDGDSSNDVLANVGDRVQGWGDFSDYHRHAVQDHKKARPTLAVSKHGGRVLHFSGDNWLERAGEVLPPKSSQFTIFLVFQPAALPAHVGVLFGQLNDREGCTSRCLNISPDGRFLEDEFWSAGGEPLRTAAGSVAKDQMHVACILRNGTQRSIKIHTVGDTISASDSAAEDYTGYAPECWRIGSRQLKENLQSFDGDIAELLAFDRALDDKSIKHLEAYLVAKYLNKSPDTK